VLAILPAYLENVILPLAKGYRDSRYALQQGIVCC